MSGSLDPFDQIDAYLDGTLSEHARREFDTHLSEDRALRESVALQRRIDRSLRGAFVVPAASITLPATKPVAHTPAAKSWKPSLGNVPIRTVFVAIAATIALLFSGYQVREFLFPEGSSQGEAVERAPRTFDVIYKAQVAAGFEPGWSCDTDQQFTDAFQSRLGQPLLMKAVPGVTYVGLAYQHCGSSKTIALLARAENREIMVFAERAIDPPAQELPASSGLKSFSRKIGNIVLYEVTPLAGSRLLDLFYEPTAKPQ